MNMTLMVSLAPRDEALLRERAQREGKTEEEIATEILREELRAKPLPPTSPAAANASVEIPAFWQDYVGTFASTAVDSATILPPRTPLKQAVSDIIAEKYRKQGFNV